MNYKTYNVKDLKQLLNSYNFIDGVSKMKKAELIKNLEAIENYSNTIENHDYKTFKFSNKTIILDDDQYKIVTAGKYQNMRIVSCAGSGKTTTIICRIKYLIDNGISPEQIMATTFNVDAAENLKNKLIDVFGFLPRVKLGTIDSVSCGFYHQYCKQDYEVGISEYSAYFLKYLTTTGGHEITNQYKYLFFDEFQDISDSQFSIINIFYKNGCYVTVIGDDSQSIYMFRGSSIKYILNLERYFKNLITYKLVNNYRSTPEIINLANDSIKHNTEQIQKEMIPNNISINFIPVIKYYENIYLQNNDLIKQIVKMHEIGVNYEEIAIICRNRVPLMQLEEMIEKYNNNNTNKTINYVALVNDSSQDIKPKIKNNHLTITTIHKSKGLEWSIVFIIDCEDSKFPSETDELSIQEERRLFYVATTRAGKKLYYYIAGKNNKAVKISRFIQEIDKKYYNFVNSEDRFYSFSDRRGVKWVNSVTDTVKLLTEKNINELRELDILPKINPIIVKIHEKYKFNNYIDSYYLHADFGEFIDRYITRLIGIKNNKSEGLIDRSTLIIILSSQFSYKELVFFKKFEQNFKSNMYKITLKTPKDQYIKILNEDTQYAQIAKISKNDGDINDINNIVHKLLIVSDKFTIDIKILTNCFSIKNEIPIKIKNMFVQSYNKFKDTNVPSVEVKSDIYIISLANTILNCRRRLMYKDVSKYFFENYEKLFDDMKIYTDSLLSTDLFCKKLVRNDEYDLIGEIDLLDNSNNKIIDFKCSASNKIRLEWIIQLLIYLSIMKINNKNNNIKYLEIYNPLQGEIYTIDISNWDKEVELLKYLYNMRIKNVPKVSKNKIAFPINYDNNNLYVDKINYIRDLYSKKYNIYDFKKIFGKNRQFFLDYVDNMQTNYPQYKNNINKILEYNNKKYIIIDTETTGIPVSCSYDTFYHYTEIDKYSHARLIQISWGVYSNGKLEDFRDYLIKPKGFVINNSQIHHLTMDIVRKQGIDIKLALQYLRNDLKRVNYVVGHNIKFDYNIICSELFRIKDFETLNLMEKKNLICTLESSRILKKTGKLKSLKLINLHKFLTGKGFDNQHNAKYDVMATARVFDKLVDKNLINL